MASRGPSSGSFATVRDCRNTVVGYFSTISENVRIGSLRCVRRKSTDTLSVLSRSQKSLRSINPVIPMGSVVLKVYDILCKDSEIYAPWGRNPGMPFTDSEVGLVRPHRSRKLFLPAVKSREQVVDLGNAISRRLLIRFNL